MSRVPLFAVVALVVGLALPAHAQLGLLGIENSVTLTLTPAYPGPKSAVSVTAKSSVLDLSESYLSWSVDGAITKQGIGADSTAFVAGSLGEKTDVAVQVTAPDGTRARATARIIPTRVDLLSGSNSYTPPFYRGRALPSAGTSLALQAMPNFVRPGEGHVAAADLIYTWRRNGQVLGSLSGKGKSAIVVPAPVLYAQDVFSVEVASSDGVLGGSASVRIASEDPMVALYENHPLFGILYGEALEAINFIPESEMTFTAVPYFASVVAPQDQLLEYAWNINGKEVPANTGRPNEVTIQSNPTNTLALIKLAVTHATNFFLNAAGAWSVTFSSGGSASDQFHSSAE